MLPKPMPLLTVLAACGSLAAGEGGKIRFPDDMGVVDVTAPPYRADNTGRTDATAALQQAVDDHHPHGRTLYLPDGTYRISDRIRWGDTGWNIGPQIQGESRKGTVIRLRDRAAGFQDPANPRGVIRTGDGSADNFINEIRTLTINTGRGNPGAAGVRLMANNTGGLFDVTVVSEDGRGWAGIDMAYTDMIGPLLIKDVRVEGFDVGVRCGYGVNSMTLENVELVGQRQIGLLNAGQCVSVRNLRVDGAAPAILSRGAGGSFTVVDGARLSGGGQGDAPAVRIASGQAYLRNIRVDGWRIAVADEVNVHERKGPGTIDRYLTAGPFHASPHEPAPVEIPVKDTPQVPWGDPDDWVNVIDHGADPTDQADDTAAIQRAIDSGASTVYFPYLPEPRAQGYRVGGTVRIRGEISRLIGCHSRVFVVGGAADGAPAFTIEGDGAPVRVERLFFREEGRPRNRPVFAHRGRRTAALVHIKSWLRHASLYRGNRGAGEVFFEDVCVEWPGGKGAYEADPNFRFAPGQRVWARQLDPEKPETKIVNDGASLWILGLKTERTGTLIETRGGGRTQLLGGMCYSLQRDKTSPMFVVRGGAAALSIGESSFSAKPFGIILAEVGNGETHRLGADALPRRGEGIAAPLIVAGGPAEANDPARRGEQ